jgi:hypothetical protein
MVMALKNAEKGDIYKTVASYPRKKGAKIQTRQAWKGDLVHVCANRENFFFAHTQKNLKRFMSLNPR